MPFQKIETKKKSVYVAEQILEAIQKGIYAIGDKLPPERMLAEEMGVSRPLVREALCALQLARILESKAGDGTYVAKPVKSTKLRALALLEKSESLLEALEARRALERSIVELAIEKLTPEKLAHIAQALEHMRRAAKAHDFDEFNQANWEFHAAIGKAAENSLIERAVEPLLSIMKKRLPREMRRRFYVEKGEFLETFELHRRIFEAIKAKDKQLASQEMDRHFDALEKSLREE